MARPTVAALWAWWDEHVVPAAWRPRSTEYGREFIGAGSTKKNNRWTDGWGGEYHFACASMSRLAKVWRTIKLNLRALKELGRGAAHRKGCCEVEITTGDWLERDKALPQVVNVAKIFARIGIGGSGSVYACGIRPTWLPGGWSQQEHADFWSPQYAAPCPYAAGSTSCGQGFVLAGQTAEGQWIFWIDEFGSGICVGWVGIYCRG